jgi:hypothetical protein
MKPTLNFIPIKEPVIYVLYVKRERKWVVYYVGETTKSIRRLYDHSKDVDKNEWVKCGCKYQIISAPKDKKKRKYYEAYLVVKLQPAFKHQSGKGLKSYLYKCLSRRGEKDREIIPGYGKKPVIPQNVGITVHTIMNKKPSVQISELKSVTPQVYYTQQDRNKERYKHGTYSLEGITYDEWLVNPDAWGDRNKSCWPMNHKEIVKIHRLVQKRRNGFEKDIMKQMKEEIKKVSEKESESEMAEIKSMITRNVNIPSAPPSIKTRETTLWERALEKQQKEKGTTYEKALDQQRSKEIYKMYKGNSSARILNSVVGKFNDKKVEKWSREVL